MCTTSPVYYHIIYYFLLSNLFLRIVELWVAVGHVPVRAELKALNVEVRKALVEIIKSRQWRV